MLDNVTGIIFVDDIFRLGRVGFLGLLGTAFAKRGLLAATSGFLFGHEPWNLAAVAFQDLGLNSNTAFISSQRLHLVATCCIWAAVACAEAVFYKYGQALIRYFRAPVLLAFRRPPRVLWFLYLFVVTDVYRALCSPLVSGYLKGQMEPLGDRVAAWVLSIQPYRRRVHSRSFLAARGCYSIPYRYQTLHGARKIRLLKLAPGVPCELVTADIDQDPMFVAISYKWGIETKDFGLLLKGGRQIAIQHNVYRILQSLTPLRDCLYVWIDSICINQENEVEKVAQIPLMGDIYRNADRVIACLPGIPHSELIGSDLHQLCRAYKRTEDMFTLRRASRITSQQNRWSAVKSVIQNPYWERLWIIQELVLAKQLYILAGDCILEWEAIVEFAQQQGPPLHRQWGNTIGTTFEWTTMFGTIQANRYIRMLDQLRWEQASRNGAKSHLWDVLPTTQLSQATIDLDKLYGILGLCIEAYDPLVRPDYGVSVAQAYTNASILCLRKGSLKLLHLAGLAFRQSSTDLPSWVLDLRPNRAAGQHAIPIYSNVELYTAAIGMAAEMELSPPSCLFGIRGFLLDTIVACDSGRTLDDHKTHVLELISGLENLNFNMDAKDKAVMNILSRDRCLREYDMSAEVLSLGLMMMIHLSPDGYMARVPEIVLRHIPDMYMGIIPRDEAYWRTVMAAAPQGSAPADDTDNSSFQRMAKMAIAVGESQRLVRATYKLLQSAEDAALLVKACFFPLSLTAEESVTIVRSETLSEIVPAVWDRASGEPPTGAREFLSAYWASQTAHQVAVTERGYLSLVPRGTRPGDVLCAFAGANVPSVLRSSGDGDGSYRLWSGSAYVCLFMEGDAVRKEGEERWFKLR